MADEQTTLPWEDRQHDAHQSPADAQRAAEDDPFYEHPEILVGAAFAGGFVLAQLLKALGPGDD